MRVTPKQPNAPLEVALLRQLVALPTTTTDFSSNNKALDFIGDFLVNRGMHVVRREYDGYGALVATTRQTKTPLLMLATHSDVVPAPGEMFRMREVGGKFVGRGVWDMKFAIAAYLATVDALCNSLDTYDFGIMITTDEETDDFGTARILEEGFVPKAVLLPDGANDWQIETAAKGASYYVVTVGGKTAHGSRPWLGDSASFKVHALITDLKELFQDEGPTTRTLNISSIEVGKIGEAPNRVPDVGRISLDVRVPNSLEGERIVAELRALCKKYGASLKASNFFPPIKHDMSNSFMSEFAASVKEITGIEQSGFLSLGASSAPSFLKRGVPCIVASPTGGDRHSDDEWLNAESFAAFVPILQNYLRRVAKVPTVDNAPLSRYNKFNIAEDRSRMVRPA